MKPFQLVLIWACVVYLVQAQTKTAFLTGIIRDHCGATTAASGNFPACSKHPDFECCIAKDLGVLSPNLNTTDRTPIYAPTGTPQTFHGAANFNTWFHTTPGINLAMPINLTFSNAGNANPRVMTFDNQAFFPIDNMGFGNQGFKDGSGNSHNFHFTVEFHSRFFYQGGETFNFVGDDDLWVFINDKLALDLGGVHGALPGSITLDNLGLTKGQNYPIDIFYAERHTVESHIRIDTTLQFICTFYDRCGVCEGSGTTCPCTCTDNNLCTTDSCNQITGACTFTNVTCTSSDPCQTSACNPATGGCANTPVTCNDNNKCTNDNCVAGQGCAFTPITCNSHDPCIIDSCDPATGCKQTAVTCNDNNPCTKDVCTPGIGCQFTPVVCPFTFACENNVCNRGTGQCVNNTASCNGCQGVTCTGNACNTAKCVAPPGATPGSGTCVNTPIDCNSGNPCIVDSCDALTGCKHTPVTCTPPDSCHLATCNAVTGKCDVTAVDCSDGNSCTVDTCQPNGGSFTCVHTNRNDCPGANNCTIAFCEPPPGANGCRTVPVDCDDGNTCTTDTCDPKIGCVHTSNCPSTECQSSSCVASNCITFDKLCPIDKPGGVNCWNAECKVGKGCETAKRTDNNAACAFLLLPPEAQAGVLSGGIIAAIVIGVVVFAVISVIGGKKGYDFWKQHQRMTGNVNSNPLYENKLTGGDNPLYE